MLQYASRGEFVRIRDGIKEPLLLLFPTDLLGSIFHYISTNDVSRLLKVGSPRLSACLHRPGVIYSVRLYSSHYMVTDDQINIPDISWPSQFPSLTELVLDGLQTLQWKGGKFNATFMPPTLTSLSVQHYYPFVFFAKPGIFEEFSNSRQFFAKSHLVAEFFDRPKEDSPFVDLAPILPLLTKLSVSTTRSAFKNVMHWLRTLPPTLTSLAAPLLMYDSTPDENLFNLHKAIAILPPHLESLEITIERWGWTITLPNDLPPSLTSLKLPGYLDISTIGPHIRTLRTKGMNYPNLEEGASFPRSLTDFTSGNILRQHSHVGPPSDLLKLLPNAKRLRIESLKMTQEIMHLPPCLTDIKFTGYSRDPLTFIHLLPKTLTKWSCWTRDTLTPEMMVDFPPKLRVLKLRNGTIQDDCLKHIPQSLYRIKSGRWELTGYTLDENTKIVSRQTLRDAFAKCTVISMPSKSKMIFRELKYCPKSVTRLEDVKIGENLTLSDFPLITSLPASCPLVDCGPGGAFVPPALTQLHIQGIMKFKSMLALPKTIVIIRGGTLILEQDDITTLLTNWTSDMMRNTPGICITHPLEYHVPKSLVKQVTTNMLSDGYIFANWMTEDVHAIWEDHHYALLPDSVTHLTIVVPTQSSILGIPSREVLEGAEITAGLSEKITKLTLATNEARPRYPSGLTPRKYIDGIQIRSIFDLCRLTPSRLPSSLTELNLFGIVQLREFITISSKLPALTRLSVGSVDQVRISDETFSSFCSLLPASLRSFSLTSGTLDPLSLASLPQALEELQIGRPLPYDGEALIALPKSLTKLSIRALSIAQAYKQLLPSSLTDLRVKLVKSP